MIQMPGHRASTGTSRSRPAGKNHPSLPCLSAQCCPRGLGASLSEHSLPLLLCTSAGNSNLARTGRARLGSRSLGRLETLSCHSCSLITPCTRSCKGWTRCLQFECVRSVSRETPPDSVLPSPQRLERGLSLSMSFSPQRAEVNESPHFSGPW